MSDEIQEPKTAGALSRQVATDFGASLTVALAYIGDRLGIFKTMAPGAAVTTRQLAEGTGLDERYLREWTATMAAAGYLDYRAADATFRLNPQQAQVLANEESRFFMAGAFQYAVTCYRQIFKLMDAFKEGGGVAFADFGPEIVEAIERLFHVGYETSVASQWIPALPEIYERLKIGGEAAEVGCGAGQCLIPVAGAFPNSRFFGYDADRTSVERARRKAALSGLTSRVSFEEIAAETLSFNDRFDLVMGFNCIHDMAHPRAVLATICRILKPGGALLWSEANASDRLEENLNQSGRTLYAASTMHCLTVSLASGGEGLGTVVGENQARRMAKEAGFANFEKLAVEHPFHQVFVARR